MFDECEKANEVVMVVDQPLLKQMVLKNMKADWRLSKTVVSEDQERYLQVFPVLLTQVQYDEHRTCDLRER